MLVWAEWLRHTFFTSARERVQNIFVVHDKDNKLPYKRQKKQDKLKVRL